MDPRKKVAFYSLDLSNTFNELLYQGVLDGVKELDMDLAVVHGGQLQGPHSFETGRNFLYRIFNHKEYDGIILPNIFSFVPQEKQAKMIASLGDLPLVTIGHQVPGRSSILVDNKSGFTQLISRLIETRKIRKFGLITGPKYHHDSIERLEAFYTTLEKYGIPWDTDREYEGTWGITSGGLGAKTLLSRWGQELEAMVCFNDTMAIGALQEFGRLGIKCPKDILLTGFDNTYESRNTNPPLTTLAFPVYQMGRMAVQTLHKQLLGNKTTETRVVVSRIQLRRSTSDDVLEATVIPAMPSLFNLPSQFLPGGALENAMVKQFLDMARGLWSDISIHALRQNIRNLVVQLKAAVERESPEAFAYFCRNLFHEWFQEGKDLEPWTYILENIGKNCPVGNSTQKLQILKQTVTEGLFVLQETESIALTNERIKERIFTTRILDLGEELSAAFNEEQIISALQGFLPDMGINKCLLVRMDPRKEPWVGRIFMEWGNQTQGGKSSDQRVPISPNTNILTPSFQNKVRHFLIEPLQVRDEFIGYMVVDLPFQPGLLIKNLRFQISTSLIISELIQEIQAHSQTLEDRVTQRTLDLKKTNEKLRLEMAHREKVESELIRSRNLESLGLLAGGIAHDFNNLLTAIMGNASLLEMGSMEPEEMDHCIHDILNASLRARDLTQQLLTFSKGGSPVKSRTSLAQVVEETAQFSLRGQSIKPQFDFPPHLWDVEADKGQLSQVVNNLVINAVQAMPQGGTVWFKGENLTPGLSPDYSGAEDCVRLTIKDDGPGIPELLVERIFDPYFTTKKDGNGLGLATSLGIIKRHGGHIAVQSAEGQGTAFIITIPRATTKSEISQSKVLTPPGRQLKILLLEDQDTVRAVMVRLLEGMGHRIVTAEEGQTAVDQFMIAEKVEPFDLIILDLVIPGGLGGADTLKVLRTLRKDLYAIASSGYSDQGGIGNFGTMGFDDLLPKPFQLHDIRKALGKFLLAGRRS